MRSEITSQLAIFGADIRCAPVRTVRVMRTGLRGNWEMRGYAVIVPPSGAESDVSVLLPNMNTSGMPQGRKQGDEKGQDRAWCCVPGCCKFGDRRVDLAQSVRVYCNNEHCDAGNYMHRPCFEDWERGILSFLKGCGRARSWSDRQRLQNVWTKKGYDLARKACACNCGRGHIRKDLDWSPPAGTALREEPAEPTDRKKKKKKKTAVRPSLTVVAGSRAEIQPTNRTRMNSVGSTESGSGSPSPSLCAGSPVSPPVVVEKRKLRADRSRYVRTLSPSRSTRAFLLRRHGSGGVGLFSRRISFNSFNRLPRCKMNSYNIKMEDEGSHGNDETRCFVLSSFMYGKTSCVLCREVLIIFDRYPLIDGTFFLSPRQYLKSCIQVKMDGRVQYLCAVCIGCLEGWNRSHLSCRYCHTSWDGSHLILGTMYSFDIFAATPCCRERFKCTRCRQLIANPSQKLQYFSDYSQPKSCPHCGTLDYHTVKSVAFCHPTDHI